MTCINKISCIQNAVKKSFGHAVIALGIVVSLEACTTLPNTIPTLQETLNYSNSMADKYQIDSQWWTAYQDTELNRLVELAFQNNIDLKQSAIRINRALYQANLLSADLFPTFSGSASASVKKNIKNGGSSVRSFGGELGVNYEIDLWRKLSDAVSAQEWEHQATKEDLEAVKLTLINNVIDAYFHLAYLNDAINITQQNIENYKKLLTLTTTKYNLGKVAVIEPTQSRQSVLNAQSTLLDLQTQKNNVEQTLADLLNVRSFNELNLSPSSIETISPLMVDLNVPIAMLIHRPDLRAAEFRLNKAFKNWESVNKSWLPTVTIGASLDSSSNKIGSAFHVPFLGGNVTIRLPFLDWNRLKWNVKISESEFEEMKLNLEQLVTTAVNEINASYIAYQNAQDILQNSEETYKNDGKITSYYKERYLLGAQELIYWLNAATTEDQSRLSILNNRYKVIQNENLIYKAMAGRYKGISNIEPASNKT